MSSEPKSKFPSGDEIWDRFATGGDAFDESHDLDSGSPTLQQLTGHY